MKNKFFISVVAILASIFFSLPGLAAPGAEEEKTSIHEIELETHQDYQVVEENTGDISKLARKAASSSVNKTVFGFHPYWMGDAYKDYRGDLLTHVAYFGVKLNADGTVSDKHDWPHTDLVSWAHERGVKVVLVARNFTTSEVTTLLASSANRERAANNLLAEVKAAGADGVNIDFEYVAGSQRNNFVTFIQNLSSVFHNNITDSHVSIDTPAVDWNNGYDFAKLAEASDGLMIMAYDYHWSSASQAGPVAPYDDSSKWGGYNVVSTLETYLTATGDDRGKLILGVPYYGYDWPTSSASVPTNTTGTGTAKAYNDIQADLASGKSRKWDEDSRSPYYNYGSYRQVWYEDASSLNYKYDLVNSSGIAGIGIWALGYDGARTELWDRIEEKFGKLSSFSLLTPPDGSVISEARPTFRWNEVTGSGVSYKLRYSRFANFSSYQDVNGIGSTSHTLGSDLTPGTYYWKVLAYNGDEEIWSNEAWNFAYDPNSGNPELSIVTAAGPGGGPHVRSFSYFGEEQQSPHKLFPYPEAFRGGVYVAAGDVDADGTDEIITAPRAGGGPQVRVFEQDGSPRGIELWPFHPSSRTGISVAAGDVDGDGKDEIAVAQAEQGHAWVKVYRYNNEKTIIGEWNAFGNAECGASVAMGDIDKDGKAEIIVGAGPGGGPQIRVFEADGTPKPIQFFAFSPSYRGGVDVAAGDVDGDGKDEIGVTQKNEQAWTKVYRYNNEKTIVGEWKAFGDFSVGGFIELGDVDRDGLAEVVIGAGNTGGPQILGFKATGQSLSFVNFFAYARGFRGGTDVALANF